MSEAAIQKGGVGVPTSLAAFAAGFEAYFDTNITSSSSPDDILPSSSPTSRQYVSELQSNFPATVHKEIAAGISRAIDYQSPAYGRLYLDRLKKVAQIERVRGSADPVLLRETARYLALWMTYEDMPRVADLKIRKARFDRVHEEVGNVPDGLVLIHEYFHPRLEEIADSLPKAIGQWLMKPSWVNRLLTRLTHKGRVIRSSSLAGFSLLYVVSKLRAVRPKSLRYHRENGHLEAWLTRVISTAEHNYELA